MSLLSVPFSWLRSALTRARASLPRIGDAPADEEAVRERVRFSRLPHLLLCTADLDGRFLTLNRNWEVLLGHSRDELTSRPFLDFVHPEDRARTLAEVDRLKGGGSSVAFENRYRATDGTYRWLSWMVTSYPDEGRLYAAAQEVTDRKRAERAELEAARRLRSMIDTALDAVVGIDDQGNVTIWNPRAEALFGWSADEVRGRSFVESLFPPSTREAHRVVLDGLLHQPNDPERSRRLETTAVHRDGREFAVELALSSARVAGEWAVTSFIRDVEDRRRTERAVRESEARFRALVENSPVAVWQVDLEGTTLYANPATAELLELEDAGELLGRADGPYFTDASLAEIRRQEALRPEGVASTYEAELVTAGGRQRDVLISAAPIFGDDGRIHSTIGTIIDLTDRKELEERFRQSQKMESIGRLAGGIAHDFNNILTTILSTAELALLELPPDHAGRGDFGEIRDAADRAARLTNQLLAFSRKQVALVRVLDLNEIVRESEEMLRRVIGGHLLLETALEPRLWPVEADPSQLEQVILNLVVNARDAMPEGGTLTISTRNVSVGPDTVGAPADLAEGDYAVLGVRDTGTGMDEETRVRLFEPFFTTKPPGEGTGLGLATVYGIVAQANGSVGVTSIPGSGTTMDVYVPRVVLPVEKPVGPAERAGEG